MGRKSSVLAKTIAAFRKNGLLSPFRLLSQDVRGLLLRWHTDWKPFNAVVFSSIAFMFCASLFPALTFANDLYIRTDAHWGRIEVIFSTGLCGVVFSIFSIQPLTILGVTGPFAILAESIYKLSKSSFNIDFLPLMAWTSIHTGWMLSLLAVFNASEYTMVYVTDFTCEIFGFLSGMFYLLKAIQELQRAHTMLTFAAFLFSVILCAGTFLLTLLLSSAPNWPPIFGTRIRIVLRQYAILISFLVFVAISYAPELAALDEAPIYTSHVTFRPSLPSRNGFFVQFWKTPTAFVFGSMAPAVIITMLFFFDHIISSIMCTARRYGTRKPNGFAQPIVLLGLTTAICGILGIPPANGLLPQAPLHAESLLDDVNDSADGIALTEDNHDDQDPKGAEQLRLQQCVHEQRYSNLFSSGGVLAFIAPPLQKLLSFAPTPILAGIFLYMSYQAITGNPILRRLSYIITPRSSLPHLPPEVPGWRGIHAYTVLQVVIAGIVFAITFTPAGPAFPVLVFSLVPLRLKLVRRFWRKQTLIFVDRWSCKDGHPEDEPPAIMEGEEAEDVEVASLRQRKGKRAAALYSFLRSKPGQVPFSHPEPIPDDLDTRPRFVPLDTTSSMHVMPSSDEINNAKPFHSYRAVRAREWLDRPDQHEDDETQRCDHTSSLVDVPLSDGWQGHLDVEHIYNHNELDSSRSTRRGSSVAPYPRPSQYPLSVNYSEEPAIMPMPEEDEYRQTSYSTGSCPLCVSKSDMLRP